MIAVRVLPPAARGQDGQHTLPEPVRLLQVRVPGQDELRDTQPGVLLDPVGDLGMAADQRGPGPAPDQPDPGPQVRGNLQPVPGPAVQFPHPAQPLRLAGGQAGLDLADHRLVDVLDQPVRLPPGLPGGVPADHMQPDAEPHRPRRGQVRDPAQLRRHRVRGLAPGQVDVAVAGRHRSRRRRRAAEVQVGYRVGQPGQPRALHLQVLAVEVHRLAGPQPGHDAEELGAPFVPLLLAGEVAVSPLLGGLTAGHHVQQQAAAGVTLKRRGHLRGKGRRDQPGPEGDEELEPLGHLGEHGRGQPGVLAPGPRRGEGGFEPELLRTAGDLAEVAE